MRSSLVLRATDQVAHEALVRAGFPEDVALVAQDSAWRVVEGAKAPVSRSTFTSMCLTFATVSDLLSDAPQRAWATVQRLGAIWLPRLITESDAEARIVLKSVPRVLERLYRKRSKPESAQAAIDTLLTCLLALRGWIGRSGQPAKPSSPSEPFAWEPTGASRVRFTGPNGLDTTVAGAAATWLLRALEARPDYRSWKHLAGKNEGHLFDRHDADSARKAVQRAVKDHPALKPYVHATKSKGIWLSPEPVRAS